MRRSAWRAPASWRFASTSAPYLEKQVASLIATALAAGARRGSTSGSMGLGQQLEFAQQKTGRYAKRLFFQKREGVVPSHF